MQCSAQGTYLAGSLPGRLIASLIRMSMSSVRGDGCLPHLMFHSALAALSVILFIPLSPSSEAGP